MYKIIKTGSKGNAAIIDKQILIDCGVPYKDLPVAELKLVLLTHEHSDHFNSATISRLAIERPTLRFACGKFLVKRLVQARVPYTRIDILNSGVWYKYNNNIAVSPIVLYHDVPNYGYRLLIKGKKLIYATDTSTLEGIQAKNYDYYLLEANYEEDEIQQKIKEKESTGQYVYEYRVLKTHLSKEQCDSFLLENMGNMSKYEYLHCHED